MNKILDHLLDGFASGDIVFICAVIIIALIFNIPNISRYLNDRKKYRIELIKDSLNSTHVNGHTKAFLEKLLEQEYFNSATGIYLEKEIREAFIESHRALSGELKFEHFKRSIPYIKYKNNTLEIKIDWFSTIGAIYNFVIGFASLIAGIFLLILPAFGKSTLTQLMPIYVTAVFLISFGGIILFQILPIISAKYVKDALKKA